MNNSNQLKAETQEFHDRTERVMNAKLLFSNQFNLDHYKNFILKSYSYISAIKQITAVNWSIYDDIITRKQHALIIDLKHIKALDLSTKKTIVNNNNKFYNLGLVYIILRAMLGNKIILKKLQDYPSFKDYPFAYLSDHQYDFTKIQRDFQERINSLEQEELNSVIQGAKDGYILFSE